MSGKVAGISQGCSVSSLLVGKGPSSPHSCSGDVPSGFLVGTLAQEWHYLWVPEGHMSLWPALAQEPLPPIKRSTSPVAATLAVGALALDIPHFLAQPLDVQL